MDLFGSSSSSSSATTQQQVATQGGGAGSVTVSTGAQGVTNLTVQSVDSVNFKTSALLGATALATGQAAFDLVHSANTTNANVAGYAISSVTDMAKSVAAQNAAMSLQAINLSNQNTTQVAGYAISSVTDMAKMATSQNAAMSLQAINLANQNTTQVLQTLDTVTSRASITAQNALQTAATIAAQAAPVSQGNVDITAAQNDLVKYALIGAGLLGVAIVFKS